MTKGLLKSLSLYMTFLMAGCSDDTPTYSQLSPEMQSAKSRALALCAGCHGPVGISTSKIIPNLAGQQKDYMVKQLLDFSSGKRANHPPMTYITRMLTDNEIEMISLWYESL